ncbi:MAG: aryl sulfotransferase, partial [Rhodospirillaceae bacterium]|nr:aryl sulfotransferase [Rhodospirillaceae bacterium]
MRPRNFGLRVSEPEATKGFTLYSPLWRPNTYLLNMAGEVVHEWELPGNPGGYSRLLPNGNLFYGSATEGGPPFKGGASGGLMREVDWGGNVIM